MQIAIIGFSRFGQLWASIMSGYGEVTVFNRSDKSDLASEHNVKFFTFDDIEKIKEADMVFVATAISSIESVIQLIKPYISTKTLVMDVASVKVRPCEWLLKNFDDSVEIMGTHPMFGPDSAKSGLNGKQIVLCPLRIEDSKLKLLSSFFTGLGMEVIEMTPDEHDRQTAYSLAMVHFLGRGLGNLNLSDIKITTLGFTLFNQIRQNVLNDSIQLFNDMQRFNPYAKSVRMELMESLKKVDSEIPQK